MTDYLVLDWHIRNSYKIDLKLLIEVYIFIAVS